MKKETNRFKYKVYNEPPSGLSDYMLITSTSLFDAFRQIGFYHNKHSPFDSINLVVYTETGTVFQVYLEWYNDHSLEVKYHECTQINSGNPVLIPFDDIKKQPDQFEQELFNTPVEETIKSMAYEPPPSDCLKWTWKMLNNFTLSELENIREKTKQNLAIIQQQKHVVIANILSLQEMIEDEAKITDAAFTLSKENETDESD